MKHTPGPWSINEYGKVVGPDKETVSINGVSMPCGFVPPQDVSNANAALIAAAPELLEALKRCVECLNGPVSDLMTGDALAAAGVYGALVQAGAAIAKAEGRE